MSSPTRTRMTGIGRVLVIVYAIMALASTGRSFVQIVERFDEAPLAYTLSAISAVVYILATLAQAPNRPRLVVGFAAETERVVDHATAKRTRKGANWIVANDVSGDVMGGDANTVHLVTADGVEDWEPLSKDAVARRLAQRIAVALA